MPRLPVPGHDSGRWGTLLNNYLKVEHNSNGTHKTLPIKRGGTGATSAIAARSNLGLRTNTHISTAVNTHASVDNPHADYAYKTWENTFTRAQNLKVLDLNSANPVPTTTPLNGIGLYADNGDLKYRSSSGSVTILGGTGTVFSNDTTTVNAADYGVDPTGQTDSSPALQAAIQAASDGAWSRGSFQRIGMVYLPPGIYRCESEILLTVTPIATGIMGAGQNATIIYNPTDLGPDKYALRWDGPNYDNPYIQSLALRGPGNNGVAYGQKPCQMNGIHLYFGRAKELAVSGYNTGVNMSRDHCVLMDSTVNDCYYNVNFGHPDGGIADQSILNCNLLRAKRASIGVAGTNVFGGVTITNTRLGEAPYCLWAESKTNNIGQPVDVVFGRPQDLSIAGCVFTNVSFEGYMNAAMGDEDLNRMVNSNVFLGCRVSNPFASGGISGESKDASIHGGFVNYNTCYASDVFLHPGATCAIKGNPAGTNRYISSCSVVDLVSLFAGGKTFSTATDSFNNVFQTTDGAVVETSLLSGNSGSVATYDLLATDNYLVRTYTTLADATRNVAVGVALHDATGYHRTVLLAKKGPIKVKTQDGSLTSGMMVKADPVNAGCVMAAAGPNDGQILGYTLETPSGGLVKVHLN